MGLCVLKVLSAQRFAIHPGRLIARWTAAVRAICHLRESRQFDHPATGSTLGALRLAEDHDMQFIPHDRAEAIRGANARASCRIEDYYLLPDEKKDGTFDMTVISSGWDAMHGLGTQRGTSAVVDAARLRGNHTALRV